MYYISVGYFLLLNLYESLEYDTINLVIIQIIKYTKNLILITSKEVLKTV